MGCLAQIYYGGKFVCSWCRCFNSSFGSSRLIERAQRYLLFTEYSWFWLEMFCLKGCFLDGFGYLRVRNRFRAWLGLSSLSWQLSIFDVKEKLIILPRLMLCGLVGRFQVVRHVKILAFYMTKKVLSCHSNVEVDNIYSLYITQKLKKLTFSWTMRFSITVEE